MAVTVSRPDAVHVPADPGWALAYFAAFAVALLFAAITVANKRDA